MAINPLPISPNLENLKKRAKSLLKSVKLSDPQALDLVGPYFGTPQDITLQQAQLVIARSYGFSSWTKLKAHISEGDPVKINSDQLTNEFIDLVTVAYGSVPDFGPNRFQRAEELLVENPEIRVENIYSASAIGDVDQIVYWLDQDPKLITQKGGFFNWEPIMYCAYGRLPNASTYEAAMKLLERGANPNAYYMWGGQYKFTALTGVFAHGEGGPINQPEHPDCFAFARALLEHGANPNDSQVAYNRCFNPDNDWLELLLEFGLSAKDKNNWLLNENGNLVPNPSETMHFQLIHAIKCGFVERVKLLIEHGVDLEKPDETYETRTKGKTPYHTAMISGESVIAKLLIDAGAKNEGLSIEDKFQVDCLAGKTTQALKMVDATPNLLTKVNQRDMLCDAATRNNLPAIKTMIALGFDVNSGRDNTAMHQAALHAGVEMVQLLLDAGGDPTIRDTGYFQTPLGFALHAEKMDVVELLETQDMDIFTAVARGKIEKLEELLSEDSSLLDIRFSEVRSGDKHFEGDWLTPLANAAFCKQLSAVQVLLEQGANPMLTNDANMSIYDLAREHSNKEVASLIEKYLE